MENLLKKILLVLFVTLLSSCLFISCGGGTDDDLNQTLTIENKGTYTLNRFTIKFGTEDKNLLSYQDIGTFSPGSKHTFTIPFGAKVFILEGVRYGETVQTVTFPLTSHFSIDDNTIWYYVN